MDSCIESWQRERKTGKMDLFCVVLLSLTLLGSLIYLATSWWDQININTIIIESGPATSPRLFHKGF